jgi:hypothetical protein
MKGFQQSLPTTRIKKNEDQKFAESAQGPSPREPSGSPQRPRIHHQQVEPTLQGSSGLIVLPGFFGDICSTAFCGGFGVASRLITSFEGVPLLSAFSLKFDKSFDLL